VVDVIAGYVGPAPVDDVLVTIVLVVPLNILPGDTDNSIV
jgi:hypothetical protein